MKRVGLVIKDQWDALELGREIHSYLAERGFEVVADRESFEKAGIAEGCIIGRMDVDLFIVLGGDGTILKTISRAADKDTPILGINFGTTGFLTQVEPEGWRDALERVVGGRFELEERTKVGVRVGRRRACALNEAVIITSVPVEILFLRLMVNGSLAQEFKADGLIISTPTGSTAYSKSCGGPILDPRLQGFVITPICPFEGGFKSLVVPQDAEIEVRLEGKSSALVVIDGEEKIPLPVGGTAAFTLSEERSRFLSLRRNFYSKLRGRG